MADYRAPDSFSRIVLKYCEFIIKEIKEQQKVYALEVKTSSYDVGNGKLTVFFADMWDIKFSLTFDCITLSSLSEAVASERIEQKIRMSIIYSRLKRAKDFCPHGYKQISQEKFIEYAHWHFTTIFSKLPKDYPAAFFENSDDHILYLFDKYGEGHYYYDSLYSDFPDNDYSAEWDPEDGQWYVWASNNKHVTLEDYIMNYGDN